MNCQLCLKEEATQKNSHIIPKFMTKSLFGETNIKRAYTIGIDRMDKPPKFSQSSAKQDHILCESCEKYFSVLETYIATRLHNRLWHIRYTPEFTNLLVQDAPMKVCDQIDANIFRLFVYSIVFRCHISTIEICDGFKLEPEEINVLRNTLNICKYIKETDLVNNITKHTQDIAILPFFIFTAEKFDDRTKNRIDIHSTSKNPYSLVMNEYCLLFSFMNSERVKNLEGFYNHDESKIKIGFFSMEFWIKLRTEYFERFIKETNKNLKSN